jgi:hypothetical protein
MTTHGPVRRLIGAGFLISCLSFMAGCDQPPAEGTTKPPAPDETDGPGGIEIDAIPQAHTSSTDVKKWKLQDRKRDMVITGKSSDGKQRFRARIEWTPSFSNMLLIVTQPKTTIMYVDDNDPFFSRALDADTKKYLTQLQRDLNGRKNGFDGNCYGSSLACGLGLTTLVQDAIGGKASSDMAKDAVVAGNACGSAAEDCHWVEAIENSMETMGEAVEECTDITTEYGLVLPCNGFGP